MADFLWRLGALTLALAPMLAHATPPPAMDGGTQAREEPRVKAMGSASEQDAATMQAWLTATQWRTFHRSIYRTEVRLIFTPEGLYRRTTFSDMGRDTVGRWRLVLHTPLSGRLWLDEDNLTFTRMDTELQLAHNRLHPAGARTEADDPKRPNAQSLYPDAFQRLSAQPWYRTDSCKPDVMPESLLFTPDGRFSASYSHPACIHRGTVDLYVSAGVISLQHGSTTCPKTHRGWTSEAHTVEFRFDTDGRLHLGLLGSYQPMKPAPPAPGKQPAPCP
ncbi:hypothetical protein [Pyxidicoccus xibeiensis]|uniref:hypothetical protein n=1 Tax=Pyxidicoccus xibeiensis TaxID=2906759 RepID=UPI0020A818B9|nr:hypothetical protein [Pyxidicoccus xibeiensis]MCP3136489.1 hypothetical protein [Pyxidicoccus xibeiensis]